MKPKWLPELEEECAPSTPTLGMADDDVEFTDFEYSDRAEGDWVISGPLDNNRGPGRSFATPRDAERWLRVRYGVRFKRMLAESTGLGRWSALIREDLCTN